MLGKLIALIVKFKVASRLIEWLRDRHQRNQRDIPPGKDTP